MESSTVGSATSTCWKRRSSAGSFSIRSRYSSSVVAPTMRSSPRASIGLSMLPASMAESPPAPAPTTVCSSSMKVMIWPSLSLISARTVLSRSSNSPRYFAPATIAPRSSATSRLFLQGLGHVALDDPLGEPLDDGGLADAGLADEHGVVLRTAREHLHDAADLLVPADDRVELALAGGGREVGAELLQRLVLALGVGCGHPASSPRSSGTRPAASSRWPPARSSTSPAGPPLAAMPMSRCSVERYSSPSSLARCAGVGDDGEQLAVGLRRRDGRARSRWAARRATCSAPARTAAWSASTAASRSVMFSLSCPCEQGEQQVRGGQVGVPVGHGPAAGRVDRVPAPVGQLGVHVRFLLLDVSSPRTSPID